MSTTQLSWALHRLARAQGGKLDKLRLTSSLQDLPEIACSEHLLSIVCQRMDLGHPRWLEQPDIAHCPLLAWSKEYGWGVILQRNALGVWLMVTESGKHQVPATPAALKSAYVLIRTVRTSWGIKALFGQQAEFSALVSNSLRLYRRDILEACAASVFMGFLALATSLFSMQVYDRVIPTQNHHTLIVLISGVLLTIVMELILKFTRSKLLEHVAIGLDNRLSRDIFTRLMQLRVDQLPASVGSLAAQVRGYEQVRGFFTANTLFTLIDLPLGLFFLTIIAMIGTPLVAMVPLGFGILALLLGLRLRRKIMHQAQEGAALSNMKTGMLVEVVEGIETIKAGSGGWKFLSRWIDVNLHTAKNDVKIRKLSDGVGYFAGSMQQMSYAGVVATGALMVTQGHMTMGALIACSILSGRILTPVMALPGLLVQQAHAKAAIEGLERLYKLKVDNHDTEQVLVPERVQGRYELRDIEFEYQGGVLALKTPKLNIAPGERVAIMGPIGSGKSTLLRLLAGIYTPTKGVVLLDGMDLTQIHRQVVSEHIGYLQQEHRLFQGTLRENLLVGLPDPGDDVLQKTMQSTGMHAFVIAHPKGLERPIMEGGKGLSGGQKQLLAFTRLLLIDPQVLLLDEPTATMDEKQENTCLRLLAQQADNGKTMVIVTHRTSVLPLVNRVIVVSGSSVVVDGPRDTVLDRLKQQNRASVPKSTAASPAQQSITDHRKQAVLGSTSHAK